MYGNGTIVSGPLESLIDLLMPGNVEEFDQVREQQAATASSLCIHGPTVACIQCSRQTCVIVRAWKSNCASFAFSSFTNSLFLLPLSPSLSISLCISPHTSNTGVRLFVPAVGQIFHPLVRVARKAAGIDTGAGTARAHCAAARRLDAHVPVRLSRRAHDESRQTYRS